MTPRPFALVDCNSFFCSCERLFDPTTWGRPLVVLSNNDGCIIARTPEAKALGFKMGQPYHEAADCIRRHKVLVRSSNYTLYSDISRRVMATLEALCPAMEVYSIDEAFLTVPDGLTREDRRRWGQEIRRTLWRHVGIPVGLGIGATKTLAKIANRLAKSQEGFFDLWERDDLEAILEDFPVGDVWGIGRRLARRLMTEGIVNARQLRDLPPAWARTTMTVSGERLVNELRGIPCRELTIEAECAKSVVCSRMFSEKLSALEPMEEAIASYASRVAERLRKQNLAAGLIFVSLTTGHHASGPRHDGSASQSFPEPTSDTLELVEAAKSLLRRIYRPGFLYTRCGITALDLAEEASVQKDLFGLQKTSRGSVWQAVDSINRKWGRRSVHLLAEGTAQHWQTRHEMRSPHYTSRWEEIATART